MKTTQRMDRKQTRERERERERAFDNCINTRHGTMHGSVGAALVVHHEGFNRSSNFPNSSPTMQTTKSRGIQTGLVRFVVVVVDSWSGKPIMSKCRHVMVFHFWFQCDHTFKRTSVWQQTKRNHEQNALYYKSQLTTIGAAATTKVNWNQWETVAGMVSCTRLCFVGGSRTTSITDGSRWRAHHRREPGPKPRLLSMRAASALRRHAGGPGDGETGRPNSPRARFVVDASHGVSILYQGKYRSGIVTRVH
jgi:hypothetical protein